MLRKVKDFCQSDSGATAMEYALIAALVGVGIVAGAFALGNNTNGMYVSLSTFTDMIGL